MGKLAWILALVAVAVAALLVLRGGDPRQVGAEAAPDIGRAGTPARRAPAELREVETLSAARSTTPALEAPSSEDAVPGGPRALATADEVPVRGRVLDVDGASMSGFEVRADSERGEPLAVTDAAGSFELALPEGRGLTLVAERKGWVTVRKSVVDRWTAGRAHLIVVSRAVDLAGRVVDDAGNPVADAVVIVDFRDEQLSRFPLPLDMSRRAAFRAQGSASGRFELKAAPSTPGARLVARAPEHETVRRAVPATSDANVVIQLARSDDEDSDPGRIVGTVTLPDGRPAVGARVALASEEVVADEAGAFELLFAKLWNYDDASPLVAGLEGYGPAVLPRYGELVRMHVESAGGEEPRGVVDDLSLFLVEGSFEIEGRVVDSAGRGLAGWNVSLEDPVEVSRGQVPPVLAETLGSDGAEDETDAEGAFRLHGLLERNYRLRAYDTRTMASVETDPVLAGRRDVEIVIGEGLLHERLEGRVESRNGRPVVGARVSVGLVTYRSGGAVGWTSAEAVATDEDGSFTLTDVPRRGARLDVGGEDVTPQSYEIPEELYGPLVLSVARRCHFRVTVEGSSVEGCRIQALDDEGKPQRITTFRASSWSASTVKKLSDDGTMTVCAISEDVRTIALSRDGEELGRQDVALDPDRVNEVRFRVP